jgi:hypothetical protein
MVVVGASKHYRTRLLRLINGLLSLREEPFKIVWAMAATGRQEPDMGIQQITEKQS